MMHDKDRHIISVTQTVRGPRPVVAGREDQGKRKSLGVAQGPGNMEGLGIGTSRKKRQ